jgi:hypothetical protein
MIPKDKIEMAKRADLPRVLQAMGIEIVSNGKGYHLREHDSLKLFQQDGIWLYKWWSRHGPSTSLWHEFSWSSGHIISGSDL